MQRRDCAGARARRSRGHRCCCPSAPPLASHLPSAERTRVRSSGPGWAACRREPRRASPSRNSSQQAPRRRTPRDRHAIAKVPLSALEGATLVPLAASASPATDRPSAAPFPPGAGEMRPTSGGGGIRTHEGPNGPQRFSRPVRRSVKTVRRAARVPHRGCRFTRKQKVRTAVRGEYSGGNGAGAGNLLDARSAIRSGLRATRGQHARPGCPSCPHHTILPPRS